MQQVADIVPGVVAAAAILAIKLHSNGIQAATARQLEQQALATCQTIPTTPVSKQWLDLVDCPQADTGAEGDGTPDHT